MYTTIEPRLIALLNDEPLESLTTSPSRGLPTLHDPNVVKASGRPLLLEPDASKRSGKSTPNAQLVQQQTTLIASIEDSGSKHETSEAPKNAGKELRVADRALGRSSPQSLRKILDGDIGNPLALSSKKRHMAESGKDEFVQLPQPPKKQKAAKQVVPPIIIGLFEPPPQATLFPPIASSSFHDSHGRNSLNTVPPKITELEDSSKQDHSPDEVEKRRTSSKGPKNKDVKARKKWTEEETNNLLLGVHKYGVGRWTDILEDPSFSFNDRSGVDLKDRFRTCCPAELRGTPPRNRNSAKQPARNARIDLAQAKSKSSLMSENILIDEEIAINGTGNSGDQFLSNRSRKSRAHRKKLEDLAQLGIEGPFRKSQRRERRPFSDDDDREILEGYNIYGPAWTRIQRDPRFHLQSRQPTDLRDRFRNKYPEKFRPGEDIGSKAAQNLDERGKENSAAIVTTPSPTHQPLASRDCLRVKTVTSLQNGKTTSKALPLQPQMLLCGYKENFTPFSDHPGAIDTSDGLPFTQSFDWNGGINAPFSASMGEMDISRLLLDETWIDNANGRDKQSFTEIHSIITSSADPLPNGPSFYNMLACDPEQIVNIPSSTTLDHDASF